MPRDGARDREEDAADPDLRHTKKHAEPNAEAASTVPVASAAAPPTTAAMTPE